MNDDEFIEFLKKVLIKIENVINLIEQDIPKHIPAYNKMLGVQQKLVELDEKHKAQMFSQLIMTRSIVNYFINGRYQDGYNKVLKLKNELVIMCFRIKNNERNKNK